MRYVSFLFPKPPVREDMRPLFLNIMTNAIHIPRYKLREWLSRYRRIADHAIIDPSDSRTANALRLARKDIAAIEGYLKGSKTHKDSRNSHGTKKAILPPSP